MYNHMVISGELEEAMLKFVFIVIDNSQGI